MKKTMMRSALAFVLSISSCVAPTEASHRDSSYYGIVGPIKFKYIDWIELCADGYEGTLTIDNYFGQDTTDACGVFNASQCKSDGGYLGYFLDCQNQEEGCTCSGEECPCNEITRHLCDEFDFTHACDFVVEVLNPHSHGEAAGDPHFQTWAGEWYDYHAECDLKLLSVPEFGMGLGLDIHIRTTRRYQYSYIESAAVRIGDDVLQVSSFGEYALNGVIGAELPSFMGSGHFPLSSEKPDSKKHVFKIHIDEKEKIVVAAFKDLVSVKVERASNANFGSGAGLLGSFRDGKKLARDGLTVLEDANEFGQEWQVRSNEPKLFMNPNREPQYPQVCKLPSNDTFSASSRRLGGASLNHEEVEAACEHWGDKKGICTFDVMATGDLELAKHGHF